MLPDRSSGGYLGQLLFFDVLLPLLGYAVANADFDCGAQYTDKCNTAGVDWPETWFCIYIAAVIFKYITFVRPVNAVPRLR